MRINYFKSSIVTRMILFYLMLFVPIAAGFAGNVYVGALLALPLLLGAMMGITISFPILEDRSYRKRIQAFPSA